MKIVIRCLRVLLMAVVLAGMFMAFVYIGPRDTLILKARLAGASFWDSVLLNTIESGLDYGKIHARYYGEPALEWPFPGNKPGNTFSIIQVFKKKADRTAFKEATRDFPQTSYLEKK